MKVTVIGAGLAGCEAAWQLAERGIAVTLCEMKPHKMSPAHTSEYFAELVCSNSLRGAGLENAVGLLKEELRRLGSIILRAADATRVEAGGALAVDRHGFAAYVTDAIRNHPNITVVDGEVTEIPEGEVIVATGPLTSDALADHLLGLFGGDATLHFFDAAAPLVTYESIDMTKAWFASRYDKGTADYINCALSEEEYRAFREELCNAEEANVHGFEDKNVFDGCMPIEVMARRGEDTMRYGPLKPRGLKDPSTGKEPYAVVQLRRDNSDGSIYNLVGFQTHLKFGEQKRVFSMIPALANADYVRYGVMHRNTYMDSPRLLNRYYQLKTQPRISFAGQMTGVEGYVESTASGFLVGVETARRLRGMEPVDFPKETAIGALGMYISDSSVEHFQPMNINFGIITPLGYRVKGKRNKNAEISNRGLEILEGLKAKILEQEEA
ncbi:MAG: methylenetetrahydrofolate--tRNA-(uracil(54)-C(5))-methyltransferase (FADH(2)-oxidizing) TrmFO [Oscillospiraceae bacterium]|nr:methylenetetrahydrofolate--tRNA-(uracil(54)-C(5))-methyltransferase (FADH(2)-oxidizing) TrmFO [Oscillospiraceae bacterium]